MDEIEWSILKITDSLTMFLRAVGKAFTNFSHWQTSDASAVSKDCQSGRYLPSPVTELKTAVIFILLTFSLGIYATDHL